jgi:hypothetical protein
MFTRRTLLVFLILAAAYGVLALPGLFWPSYLDSPIGLIFAIPFLSIYLFHTIGIPGLLQNNGACGWGWCAPTGFGWVFLVLFWSMVGWVIAWLIASPTQQQK